MPHPRNARRHSSKQIDQIAVSISEFGFNTPIPALRPIRSTRCLGLATRHSARSCYQCIGMTIRGSPRCYAPTWNTTGCVIPRSIRTSGSVIMSSAATRRFFATGALFPSKPPRMLRSASVQTGDSVRISLSWCAASLIGGQGSPARPKRLPTPRGRACLSTERSGKWAARLPTSRRCLGQSQQVTWHCWLAASQNHCRQCPARDDRPSCQAGLQHR